MQISSALALLFAHATADPCCQTCEEPLVKYYSVDVPHGFCGEACMDPKKFSIYKIFEKNLTLADSATPCSEQFTPTGTHYTEYSETVTHGVPGLLAVTLDLYGPGASLEAPKSSEPITAGAFSGEYTGRVPGIVKITMDFSADTVKTLVSVIGQQDINCPVEPYSATDSQIAFSAIGNDGDCFGDAIRGQGKDTSKFFIDVNSDGSLSFHSDFAPVALKLTKQSLSTTSVAAVSGAYSGRVPGIVKITMDFASDTVRTLVSVIGQQDINCPVEPYSATDSQIAFSAIGNDGDCFGDAIRGQGKDTSKFFIDVNSDGSLSFHSDFAPVALKLTKQSNLVVV